MLCTASPCGHLAYTFKGQPRLSRIKAQAKRGYLGRLPIWSNVNDLKRLLKAAESGRPLTTALEKVSLQIDSSLYGTARLDIAADITTMLADARAHAEQLGLTVNDLRGLRYPMANGETETPRTLWRRLLKIQRRLRDPFHRPFVRLTSVSNDDGEHGEAVAVYRLSDTATAYLNDPATGRIDRARFETEFSQLAADFVETMHPATNCQHSFDCCGQWYAGRPEFSVAFMRHDAFLTVRQDLHLNI